MFTLYQGEGSLQALQRRRIIEEGKRKNGEESTSEEDEAMDGLGVEGTGVGEVGEGRRVGYPSLEGYRCAGEDGRDEAKDSRG